MDDWLDEAVRRGAPAVIDWFGWTPDIVAQRSFDFGRVRLVLWDGFTVAEAATILGISETTARGRYQRARARLRELLREHQYEGTIT
ncbi:putative DNA-binding protein (UPF0251 family) [Agromyces cerinus]|uniref:RNA polymerase sigma factor n=1 Tax=Agromyces cerinus TaxID=33878 RepID=UPI00195616C6|nr:sigma factor-like helix-turn-helix DNA-binding protein [Agromyces cerinus]MBM7831937.1 putative DNA-binding protein (UPF0251 family) [Agromyces cerinus]